MKILNVYRDEYDPNTATLNRFLAFVKGFSEDGIITNVYFLRPNKKKDKVNTVYQNVTFNYLWENKRYSNNKYVQYGQQILWVIYSLLKKKKGDNIILFGSNEFLFVFSLFRNLNIYYEVTEHPSLWMIGKSLHINLMFRLYYYGIRKIKGLFAISTSLREFYISKGVSADVVHTVNMIVDISRFENLKKEDTKVRYIAYCGSIVNSKDGVDDLIEAFNIVSQKVDDVKLFLIGIYNYKADEDKNLNLISKYSLQNKIIHTGELSVTEMPQILKNASVLVLARPDNLQAKNGFPTKLGEYLLTSNPVVVTSVGDIPVFLKDGESAYIAEPDNINDIADKIYCALTDERAIFIGKKGMGVALEHFNYFNEAKKISKIIFKH